MVYARKALIRAGLLDTMVPQSYLDNLIETCPQITRNQVARKGSWVRIPPLPPQFVLKVRFYGLLGHFYARFCITLPTRVEIRAIGFSIFPGLFCKKTARWESLLRHCVGSNLRRAYSGFSSLSFSGLSSSSVTPSTSSIMLALASLLELSM